MCFAQHVRPFKRPNLLVLKTLPYLVEEHESIHVARMTKWHSISVKGDFDKNQKKRAKNKPNFLLQKRLKTQHKEDVNLLICNYLHTLMSFLVYPEYAIFITFIHLTNPRV